MPGLNTEQQHLMEMKQLTKQRVQQEHLILLLMGYLQIQPIILGQ